MVLNKQLKSEEPLLLEILLLCQKNNKETNIICQFSSFIYTLKTNTLPRNQAQQHSK
jgi:hypothetical protein